MGVDHRGFDILVSQQILNSADILAVLKQVGGEGVAEGVMRYTFLDIRKLSRLYVLRAFGTKLSQN